MQVPNWKHHSRKEQKRKLKPQALRQAKARLAQFKKRHNGRPKGDLSFYDTFIRNETDVRPSRNQISTCKTACY
jgi:hypothetical protein